MEIDKYALKICTNSQKANENQKTLMAGDRKLMIIDEKYWEPMKIVEKSVKLGAKGCPRRGTIHSDLRTSQRDEASYARY